MNTGFYTNPIYLEHDTGSHPENANRLRAIQEKLESGGLLERLILQSGRSATSQEIKLLHSEKLISAVELSFIQISEPTRPLYTSYAVFCLKKKKINLPSTPLSF